MHLSKNTAIMIYYQRIRSLESEIDLLSKFSHKNIVKYIGSSRDDSVFNIFLEYVAGKIYFLDHKWLNLWVHCRRDDIQSFRKVWEV